MKYVVSHLTKKNVIKIAKETFGEDADIIIADPSSYYDWREDGWQQGLFDRVYTVLKNEIKQGEDIGFITVGFIPAVLVVWSVIEKLKNEGYIGNVVMYSFDRGKYVVVG